MTPAIPTATGVPSTQDQPGFDASDPVFNPFDQPILIYGATGEPITFSIEALLAMFKYTVLSATISGLQIGLTVVMLLATLVLSQPAKRRHPVFILNLLALAMNTVRCALVAAYFVGPFVNPYAFFAGDYSRVTTKDYASSIAASCLNSLQIMCMEASLLLQLKAVLVTSAHNRRRLILVFTGVVALAVIGFDLAVTVLHCQATAKLKIDNENSVLYAMENILIMANIGIFSMIFTAKIGHALWRRRQLGIQTFGPMDIVVIMGANTMLVPVLFGLIAFASAEPLPSLMFLTLVVIFLPLSTLWAAAAQQSTNANRVRGPDPDATLVHATDRRASESTIKSWVMQVQLLLSPDTRRTQLQPARGDVEHNGILDRETTDQGFSGAAGAVQRLYEPGGLNIYVDRSASGHPQEDTQQRHQV